MGCALVVATVCLTSTQGLPASKFWTNKIWQPHIRAVQNAVSSLNAGPKDISELHLQA